jgi:hypothetical protein
VPLSLAPGSLARRLHERDDCSGVAQAPCAYSGVIAGYHG